MFKLRNKFDCRALWVPRKESDFKFLNSMSGSKLHVCSKEEARVCASRLSSLPIPPVNRSSPRWQNWREICKTFQFTHLFLVPFSEERQRNSHISLPLSLDTDSKQKVSCFPRSSNLLAPGQQGLLSFVVLNFTLGEHDTYLYHT